MRDIALIDAALVDLIDEKKWKAALAKEAKRRRVLDGVANRWRDVELFLRKRPRRSKRAPSRGAR